MICSLNKPCMMNDQANLNGSKLSSTTLYIRSLAYVYLSKTAIYIVKHINWVKYMW